MQSDKKGEDCKTADDFVIAIQEERHKKNYKKMISLCRNSHYAINSDNLQLLLEYIIAYSLVQKKLYDPQIAVESCQKIIDSGQIEGSFLHTQLIRALRKQDCEPSKLLKKCEESREIYPEDRSLFYQCLMAYSKINLSDYCPKHTIKDDEEMESILKITAESNSKNSWERLGDLCLESGRWEDAKMCFEKNPRDYRFYNSKGIEIGNNKNFGNERYIIANDFFQMALDIGGENDSRVIINKAVVLKYLGRDNTPEHKKYYELAARLDRNFSSDYDVFLEKYFGEKGIKGEKTASVLAERKAQTTVAISK